MEVKPGVEGLIHISQLSHEHVETVEEVVSEGDVVEAEVINISSDERKIGLSIKELKSEPTKSTSSNNSNNNRNNNRRKTNKSSNRNNQTKKKKETGTKIGDLIGDELDELF
jgi:ribosomal protein S1